MVIKILSFGHESIIFGLMILSFGLKILSFGHESIIFGHANKK